MKPLRILRDERGLRLEDIACATSTGISTLSNFLSGRTKASDELITKLAAFFKVQPAEIENPQRRRNAVQSDWRQACEYLASAASDADLRRQITRALDEYQYGAANALIEMQQVRHHKRRKLGMN